MTGAGRPAPRRLMVIPAERPSEWIGKGEVVDRYYNPGEVFGHVDLVLPNDDRPPRDAVKRMVGAASFEIHNLPTPPGFFRRTLGWRPRLARPWALGAVELARRVRPDVVRCHGAHLNALAASEIRAAIGTPYAVSLHINPDVDVRAGWRPTIETVQAHAIRRVERLALRRADLVLPVYRSIVPFLERIGVERYEVAYNLLSVGGGGRKSDYGIDPPVEIVSVGRQFEQKRPDNILRAVASLPETRLTLIGDGPDHERLRDLAAELGIEDRVSFERAVPNDELQARLPGFDVFAVHSDFFEVSKAVLEAFLAGLPVVVNRRPGEPVPELTPEICFLVEDSPAGYERAMRHLVENPVERERLGRAAAARADREWSPEVTEARYAEIYRSLLALRSDRAGLD